MNNENNYYKQVESEMKQSGICEEDIQMVIKKLKDLRQQNSKLKESNDKMRSATDAERQNIDDYIKSISKQTGHNFFDYI